MNPKILGEQKKSNFDENLHEVVDKIYENKSEGNVSNQNIYIPDKEFYILNGLKACWKPEEDGALKNQKEWGDYWDKIGDGRVMMSMADLYKVIAQVSENLFLCHDHITVDQAKLFQENLRKDFSEGLVVDSCLDYGENQNIYYTRAEVVHNCVIHESMYRRSRRINILEKFLSVSLEELCEDSIGRMFLRDFFETMDGTETIIESFERVTGVKKEKVVFRVFNFPLNNLTQTSLPSKVGQIFVKEMNDSLFIDCTYSPDCAIKGRSRGVVYK